MCYFLIDTYIDTEYCYLIDTGVAGSQKIILERLEQIGRKLSDIKGIFLTHAHPDHIGTAGKTNP